MYSKLLQKFAQANKKGLQHKNVKRQLIITETCKFTKGISIDILKQMLINWIGTLL